MRIELRHVAAADAVFVLGEHDNRTAFRRLVRKRGKLRRIGQLLLGHAGERDELGCLPVAERDRPGLVEQQRIDIAGGLDRPAGHRQHVEPHEPVHSGDADCRQQGADRRRDQRDEQRHQHQHAEAAAGIGGKARDRRDREDKDQRHAGEQDIERDLVRRLLPLGSLDKRDHAVEKRRTRRRGDPHLDPIGDDFACRRSRPNGRRRSRE